MRDAADGNASDTSGVATGARVCKRRPAAKHGTPVSVTSNTKEDSGRASKSAGGNATPERGGDERKPSLLLRVMVEWGPLFGIDW